MLHHFGLRIAFFALRSGNRDDRQAAGHRFGQYDAVAFSNARAVGVDVEPPIEVGDADRRLGQLDAVGDSQCLEAGLDARGRTPEPASHLRRLAPHFWQHVYTGRMPLLVVRAAAPADRPAELPACRWKLVEVDRPIEHFIALSMKPAVFPQVIVPAPPREEHVGINDRSADGVDGIEDIGLHDLRPSLALPR